MMVVYLLPSVNAAPKVSSLKHNVDFSSAHGSVVKRLGLLLVLLIAMDCCSAQSRGSGQRSGPARSSSAQRSGSGTGPASFSIAQRSGSGTGSTGSSRSEGTVNVPSSNSRSQLQRAQTNAGRQQVPAGNTANQNGEPLQQVRQERGEGNGRGNGEGNGGGNGDNGGDNRDNGRDNRRSPPSPESREERFRNFKSETATNLREATQKGERKDVVKVLRESDNAKELGEGFRFEEAKKTEVLKKTPERVGDADVVAYKGIAEFVVETGDVDKMTDVVLQAITPEEGFASGVDPDELRTDIQATLSDINLMERIVAADPTKEFLPTLARRQLTCNRCTPVNSYICAHCWPSNACQDFWWCRA